MNTYRVYLLYTMLCEIKAGTWQPIMQCTFDPNTTDWYDNPPEAKHLATKVSGGRANIMGCAGLDQRFIDLGLRLMGDGALRFNGEMGWEARTKFFEDKIDRFRILLHGDLDLDQCIHMTRNLCNFWVKHDAGGQGMASASFLWGPGNVLLSSTLQPEQADWVAASLNEALADMEPRDAFKMWGVENGGFL